MNEKDIVTLPTTSPTIIPGNDINPSQVSTFMVGGFYTISSFGYADNFDASYNFVLPFYIDQNVNSILQVYLNLLFQKYRAFSKGAASGGGSTPTSAGGGGITTATGGDDSAHQHTILVQGENGHTGDYPIYVSTGDINGPIGDCQQGDIGQLKADVGTDTPANSGLSFKTNCTISSHTHPVVLNDHYHKVDVPAHSHDLTFGIYEAAAYPTNVGIKIDGVDRTTALDGPWSPSAINDKVLNLDLTEYITTIGYHTLELSTDTLGRCIPLLWMKTQSNK